MTDGTTDGTLRRQTPDLVLVRPGYRRPTQVSYFRYPSSSLFPDSHCTLMDTGSREGGHEIVPTDGDRRLPVSRVVGMRGARSLVRKENRKDLLAIIVEG